MTLQDKDAISTAYEDVRNDATETAWAALRYDDDNGILLGGTGTDFEELISQFVDSKRAFGYLRVTVGDELSKRTKFVLITYIGDGVSALKKAKMSTDKATVKTVIQNFAVELLYDGEDISLDDILEKVRKAGGANYGTGQRD